MNKYFIDNSDIFRVNFPDGQYVDIKSEFTQEDKDYIMSAMMQTKSINKDEPELEMNLGKQATLERAIVAWSFTDDEKPVPVTKENISRLRTKYRAKVLEEIDRLNKEANSFTKN